MVKVHLVTNCYNGIVNKFFRTTRRRGEDVLDSEFNERIQGKPVPEINWHRKEEESIQAKSFNVIRRIEK